MRRVLCLYLPFWPVERVMRRRRHDQAKSAVLVVASSPRGQIIAHACPTARGAKVRRGMTLAHARALLGGMSVVTLPHEPIRDEAALSVLARWSQRWTPLTCAESPDSLLLDITGCEHLWGDERGLASSFGSATRHLGFTPRIAVASTVGAAWAAAHAAPTGLMFVSPGAERQAIGPLPVRALRIKPHIVRSLTEIGVETIAQLLDLPRASLPGRYGPEILLRIDQAVGDAPEPVHGVVHESPLALALELPGGTTHWESLVEAMKHLLTGLSMQVRRREAGVMRLETRFARLGAPPAVIRLELSRPTRARLHLWNLLRPHLERLHLGAGIERIELRALRVEPIVHEQEVLSGFVAEHASAETCDQNGLVTSGRQGSRLSCPSLPAQSEKAFRPDVEVTQMLEVVASRFGPERIRRMTRLASHRPERAWRTEAALASEHDAPALLPVLSPRPSCMFDPPEPAEVTALCPEGPVLRLGWRGELITVRTCLGPERLAGEWWAKGEPPRDYFRLQTQGGLWLWIFRDLGSGRWCVHGVWG